MKCVCRIIFIFIIINIGLVLSNSDNVSPEKLKLVAITVATHEADGLHKLQRSASIYGVNLKVFIKKDWIFEQNFIPRLKEVKNRIEKYKNETNVVLLLIDAFDVILNAGEEEILEKFLEFKAGIVFGAEVNNICGPGVEKPLSDLANGQKNKYLNGGTLIGYAPQLYKLYSIDDVTGEKDDQCLRTKQFIDSKIRQKLNIKLDYKQKIFQNLHKAEDDVELEFTDNDARILNTLYQTRPSVIHGCGYRGKKILRNLGNYIAKSWTPTKGCMACSEGRIFLNNTSKSNYPKVLIGIFVPVKTPFLVEMLDKLVRQVYPKEKIFLYVYNKVPLHEKLINNWILKIGPKYPFVEYTSSFDNITHGEANHIAMDLCRKHSCDAFFNVISESHLDNPNTLGLLISYNRTIIAPIISRGNSLYSNFWGDIRGYYYKRSFDYIDIVTGVRRGIWAAPYIYGAYIMWRHVFDNPQREVGYIHEEEDSDTSFCVKNRRHHDENSMYAVNLEDYGQLIDLEFENPEGPYSDILQIKKNENVWESRYIHHDYFKALKNKTNIKQVCSDVFSFPVFKKNFAKDILQLLPSEIITSEIDENKITKSDNKSSDKINLSEIKFENQWKYVAKKYIEPIVELIFTGYNLAGELTSSFIHLSKPMNQSSFYPHVDPSAYTVVTSLSNPGNFLGGGIKFFRSRWKECIAPPMPSGWVTVFPGKPTHYHHVLQTKAGFKYDLVYYAV